MHTVSTGCEHTFPVSLAKIILFAMVNRWFLDQLLDGALVENPKQLAIANSM